jgi:SAM-dependent methyltransferase
MMPGMDFEGLPEHVAENRDHWNADADNWVAAGERSWASDNPFWGLWGLPEADLHLLPLDMSGLHAIDLGCGTGYVSSWMARRGAQVVGIDIAERQLETARRLARTHGVEVTWVHGSAEAVPYPDESFDFAISEYGAALWCDPWCWMAEAHRILRRGGRLVFLTPSPWVAVCSPPSGADIAASLERDYFGLHRLDWRTVEKDPGGHPCSNTRHAVPRASCPRPPARFGRSTLEGFWTGPPAVSATRRFGFRAVRRR